MAISETELKRQLMQLEMKLLKTFIKESDPDNWTGAGENIKDMGEKRKVLRKMDKQNAVATYAVLNAVREKNGRFLTKEERNKAAKPLPADEETVAAANKAARDALSHITIN